MNENIKNGLVSAEFLFFGRYRTLQSPMLQNKSECGDDPRVGSTYPHELGHPQRGGKEFFILLLILLYSARPSLDSE